MEKPVTQRPGQDLWPFFRPNGIAVVGVSDRPTNVGRHIVENLLDWGYQGTLVGVGRGGGSIRGVPVVPDVDDIPDGIDLAAIVMPARLVPALIEGLGRRGVRAATIESSGFQELGAAGRVLGAQVLEIARRHGMRLIGPNGLGTIGARARVCTPFAPLHPQPVGSVALVCQSGGMMFTFLRDLDDERLGLSHAVSFGNRMDVDESELVEYLGTDPDVRVICMYLESVRRGRALMAAVARCPKPVVLQKANRSELARTAAMSHTASLANDHAVVAAAARQSGLVCVNTAREAMTAVKGVQLPPVRGRRVAIVSRSGGHGVIAADACERYGFELPPLPEAALARVRSHVRADVIRLGNPLDLGDMWDVAAYELVLRDIAESDEIDALVFVHTVISLSDPDLPLRVARSAAAVCRETGKPIAACFYSWAGAGRRIAREAGFPVFDHVEEAVEALARNLEHHEAARRPPPHALSGAAAERSWEVAEPLELSRCLALCEQHGIPFVSTAVAETAAMAARQAARLGFPVAVKVNSLEVVHKSDVGGVALGLSSSEEVLAACARMQEDLSAPAFSVHAMARPGLELIVGTRYDRVFGPVVAVGLGGVHVELLRDVALRVAPVSHDEAREMLTELSGYPLMCGFRGGPPLDVDAAGDLIVRVSRLAVEHPELVDMELNPVFVYPAGQGCMAVDVRASAVDQSTTSS